MINDYEVYKVGYFAGRWFIKMVKYYLANKLVRSTFSEATRISKQHKIDSKNAEVVTKNVFECLQYLD